MKKLSLMLAAVVLLSAQAFGLELKDGRMRLVIEERSGRFSLHYLSDVAANRYVPLLYAQETRTTYPTLMVDQKTYRLGDSSEFRVSVVSDKSGTARVEYRSSFCVVRQTFSFVTSTGAGLADGVSIGFEIENLSQKDSAIGLRFLLDTWLGEKSQAHFAADAFGAMTAETALAAGYADAWVRSAEDLGASTATSSETASLQILLQTPATRPDLVVAANWKRLNDSAWAFDANPSRNFTLLPYSINDSAVALYFEPTVLRPGSARSMTTVLGQANAGYAATVAGTALATSIAAIAPAESAPLNEMADLIAVRTILDAINAALGSGTPSVAEELQAIDATLDRLETRKGKY